MKTCSKCRIEKSLEDFYVRDKQTNLYRKECKTCLKDNNKRNYVKRERKPYTKIKQIDIDNKNGYKICTKCDKKLNLEKFSINKKQNTYVTRCKDCILIEQNNKLERKNKEPYQKCSICKLIKERQYFSKYSPYQCAQCLNERKRNRSLEKRIKSNERHRIYMEKYRKTEKFLKARRDYDNKIRENNIHYKLKKNIARRILLVLEGKQKSANTLKLLGCSLEQFKNHIESQFVDGMNWGNYGVYKIGSPLTWHIDHIIPCKDFKLENEGEQIKCFHYTNLRPLWADINCSRHKKYT